MSNKMTSCRDKELAGKVKQLLFLYDKSHSHFHRKDIKSRIKVSEELKFENGAEAVTRTCSVKKVFLKI